MQPEAAYLQALRQSLSGRYLPAVLELLSLKVRRQVVSLTFVARPVDTLAGDNSLIF